MKNKFISNGNKAGFTLMEVLITISIFVLVGMAVWTFQKDIYVFNSVLSDSIALQTELRKAFKIMSAEIRSLSTSSIGAYPLVTTTATNFTFYCDTDNDGLKERIRYFVDGNVLKKGVLKPTGNPLAYNPANESISPMINDLTVTNSVFQYYDSNYDGTTAALAQPVNILSVKLVKITVKVDHQPNRPPGEVTMETQVAIRNLKDNL